MLTPRGWVYYKWIDSWLAAVEKNMSRTNYLKRIGWEQAETVLTLLHTRDEFKARESSSQAEADGEPRPRGGDDLRRVHSGPAAGRLIRVGDRNAARGAYRVARADGPAVPDERDRGGGVVRVASSRDQTPPRREMAALGLNARRAEAD